MNHLRTPLLFCLVALTAFNMQCANTVGDAKPGSVDVPAPGAVDPAAKAPPARATDLEDVAPTPVRVPIDGLPVFGSARALVTVVAFTDYQCPYCVRADETLAQLRKEYGDELRVVVASRPLPMHDRALPAARAFLAAVEQGKGEAMHARLFANKTASLGDDGLQAAARDVGLDASAFDRARGGSATDAAIARAEKLADALQVRGTPTLFVNGRRVLGARPIEVFRTVIDEELEKAHTAVGKGVAPEAVYASILAKAPEFVPAKASAIEIAEDVVEVGVESAPVRGSPQAPVAIVVFSDFECSYCARLSPNLSALQAANPSTLRVVYRQFPLPMHPHARLAAKASIAADRQGRFWAYHDALYAHHDALERVDLDRYAAEIGLDTARFARDIDSPEVEAAVAADEARGKALDVRGTPTSFVNGHRVGGAQPVDVWATAVERSLAVLGLRSETVRPSPPGLLAPPTP